MPRRPLRLCARPGCATLAEGRYCPAHTTATAPAAADARASASRRGYGRAWQRLRRAVLARDHWICQSCGAACGTGEGADPGERAHVDHIRAKRHGGRDEAQNLQTLCGRCHARKTNRETGRRLAARR